MLWYKMILFKFTALEAVFIATGIRTVAATHSLTKKNMRVPVTDIVSILMVFLTL